MSLQSGKMGLNHGKDRDGSGSAEVRQPFPGHGKPQEM